MGKRHRYWNYFCIVKGFFDKRESVLIHNGELCEKNDNTGFDVGQSAYDGADIAEVINLFIVNKVLN